MRFKNLTGKLFTEFLEVTLLLNVAVSQNKNGSNKNIMPQLASNLAD